MNNIIWNKDELKKIGTFLKKANYKIDDNHNIVISNRFNTGNNAFSNIMVNKDNEIKRLFYLQDREEIKEVLKSTVKLKELVIQNPNNPLYFGLISSISKLNINDDTEIFTIFKEILSQYAKVSSNLITTLTNNLEKENYIETVQNIIEKIKNSKFETDEEKYVKDYMNKILGYTSDITNSEIFKPTIEFCNNNIKNTLIQYLNQKIIFFYQRIDNEMQSSLNAYNYDKYRKIYSKKERMSKDGYNMD